LTPRKSAPLSIRLNRPSRARKGSKHDHSVEFEKNARVSKIESGSADVARQGLGRLRKTKVGRSICIQFLERQRFVFPRIVRRTIAYCEVMARHGQRFVIIESLDG
jgi:hypothetical protein